MAPSWGRSRRSCCSTSGFRPDDASGRAFDRKRARPTRREVLHRPWSGHGRGPRVVGGNPQGGRPRGTGRDLPPLGVDDVPRRRVLARAKQQRRARGQGPYRASASGLRRVHARLHRPLRSARRAPPYLRLVRLGERDVLGDARDRRAGRGDVEAHAQERPRRHRGEAVPEAHGGRVVSGQRGSRAIRAVQRAQGGRAVPGCAVPRALPTAA